MCKEEPQINEHAQPALGSPRDAPEDAVRSSWQAHFATLLKARPTTFGSLVALQLVLPKSLFWQSYFSNGDGNGGTMLSQPRHFGPITM